MLPPKYPLSYPMTLTPDEDGRLVVNFPDFHEVLTDGVDEVEALDQASDALHEALAQRLARGEYIPRPIGFLQDEEYGIVVDHDLAKSIYDYWFENS